MQQSFTHPREQGRAASPPLDAPAPLRLWHLASLDAPTVAVTWAMGFAWTARISLPGWVLALVALVTFAVYIADRLLDARSSFQSGHLHFLRARHFFHWRHRRVMAPLALVAAIAAVAIVFAFMPLGVRERNSMLAAAAVAYLSGVHSGHKSSRVPFPAKELFVAVLFASGCALPTITRLCAAGSHIPAFSPLLALVAFFTSLAWLNCRAIEHWESRDFSPSSSRIFAAGCLLGLAGMLMSVIFAAQQPRIAAFAIVGSASALMLALLDHKRRLLTSLALRVAADLVLLSPALFIPLVWLER